MESYRILFFISSLGSGGAENHLINLCRYLKSSSHTPAVCTVSSRDAELEGIVSSESVPLFRLNLGSLRELAYPANILKVKKIVDEFTPDIIHAHLFHAEVVTALAGRFTAAPLLATRHSTGLEFGGWRRWAVLLMRSRFDSLLAVSDEACREAVEMGYRRERLATVPNAVDTARFHPLDDAQRLVKKGTLLGKFFPGRAAAQHLLVGSVGGLKPVKNFNTIPRIAARFMRERPDLTPFLCFMIVGEGRQREQLTRLAEDLGAASIIAMPGNTERPEDFYPLFDVFVLPSLAEGVPMALLEAMASGAACVATDVGGVGEVLGDTGKVVPGRDENALFQAVEELLDNENERSELGRNARQKVMESYNIEAWGGKIVNTYRSVLGRG